MSRRMLLYSPVPPMKTGTADYFRALIQELATYPIDRQNIQVVVDDADPSAAVGTDFYGFPVVATRSIGRVVHENESRVYFLANNEFHSYVHRALADARVISGGRLIAVIHEPSCFMLFNNLCSNSRYGFDERQMDELGSIQFGNQARYWISARRAGLLPFDVEFWMHFQYLPITKCDEVWTHNYFSALKLLLESTSPRFPKFVVSEHPQLDRGSAPSSKLDPKYTKQFGTRRFGVFGWVSPSKRVLAIIEAFALALQTVPNDQRSKYELVVVGQLPEPGYYDPAGLVQKLDLTDCVRLWNYVPLSVFEQLLESCDLVFNLRYPSCGESSGTWHRAYANGIPIVTSGYQAFREVPADFAIPVFAPAELAALYGIILSEIGRSSPRNSQPRTQHGFGRVSISQLLVDEATAAGGAV